MTQNTSVEALLKQGHDHLDRGQYQLALEVFQQAVGLEVQNHRALYGLGLAYWQLRQYQDAVNYLTQALQIKPSYLLALARRGMAYRSLHLTEQGTADFEQAIEIEPQDSEDWRGRALALVRLKGLKRYEEAIASYDKAIEFQPNNHHTWHDRGYALYLLKRYEEAIANYEEAIKFKPDYHDAWLDRGKALSCLKRYEEAVSSYQKAVEIRPDDPKAWEIYSRELMELLKFGCGEVVLVSLNRACEINSNCYQVWFTRGHVLRHLKSYDEAVVSYEKAILIRPNEPNAWSKYRIALLKFLESGYDQAVITSLDRTFNLQSNCHEAWYVRGCILHQLGRYEEAIESYENLLAFQEDEQNYWNKYNSELLSLLDLGCYEIVISSLKKTCDINPDFYEVFFTHGDSLTQQKRYEEAVFSYEKAIEFKPNDSKSWETYSLKLFALFKLGCYKPILASLEKSLTTRPDLYNIWINCGDTLYKLKRYQEAIDSYNKALISQKNNDEIWYKYGNALLGLGRYKKAIDSYNKALKIKPDNEEALYKRGNALLQINQYKKALDSYETSLALTNYQHPYAWNGKGNALRSLGNYEEAIIAYDRALELRGNQYWRVWKNRGWAVQKLQGYSAALQNWDEGLKYLDPEISRNYKEGCGELHYCKGKANYQQGREEISPFRYWKKAKESYEIALKYLTPSEFRERYLEVLQDLIKVCRSLGQVKIAEELRSRGTDQLDRWLGEISSKSTKIQLSRKFAGFDQLRVDELAQSDYSEKRVEALERAEERKNVCLSWFRENCWSDSAGDSPKYQDIQNLLNTHTAAIYWHVSPAAITTFILRYNQPPFILFAKATPYDRYPAVAGQLRDFEDWIENWKQDYQNYRNSYFNTRSNPVNHGWRRQIDNKLRELAKILDIPRILSKLSGIKQLILIPHRVLHLLPLEALFYPPYSQQDFTITRLPSAQFGLKLQQFKPNQVDQLLSVAPQGQSLLRFAVVESAVIARIYPDLKFLLDSAADKTSVTRELQTNLSLFHFTGHGYHNLKQPNQSALELARGQRLTLEDIFKLRSGNHYLVCLPACETGITSDQNLIDEYVGIVSGFLAAGAAYVVSTLWIVETRATALLISEFYRLLKEEGVEPALALKQAQEWLRTATRSELAQWCLDQLPKLEDGDRRIKNFLERQARIWQEEINQTGLSGCPYADPYYWAGFTITGTVPQSKS